MCMYIYNVFECAAILALLLFNTPTCSVLNKQRKVLNIVKAKKQNKKFYLKHTAMCLSWNKRHGCAQARRTPWITSITANPSHAVIFFFYKHRHENMGFLLSPKTDNLIFPLLLLFWCKIRSTLNKSTPKKKTKAEKRQLLFIPLLHILLTDIPIKVKKENFDTSQRSHRQEGWVWMIWHYVEVHLSQWWRRQSFGV